MVSPPIIISLCRAAADIEALGITVAEIDSRDAVTAGESEEVFGHQAVEREMTRSQHDQMHT